MSKARKKSKTSGPDSLKRWCDGRYEMTNAFDYLWGLIIALDLFGAYFYLSFMIVGVNPSEYGHALNFGSQLMALLVLANVALVMKSRKGF